MEEGPTSGATAQGRTRTETREVGELAHKLLRECDRSARYHLARGAFLDFSHRVLLLVIIVSSSATFARLTERLAEVWVSVIAFIPTVAAAFILVSNFSRKAEDHRSLSRQCRDLAKRINVRAASEESVEEWRIALLDIYKEEPAVYHALNAQCHNAVAQSIGAGKSQMQRIRWWQARLRNIVRFTPDSFPLNQPTPRT
ncbi:MAG: hypothetical protein OXI46_00145 [Gemmatimonadota bacterium]|nr:hypothetical protein [Gemmatimonadota bacterium]